MDNVLFLKSFIEDINLNRRLTWREYAELWGTTENKVRHAWRRFRNEFYPQGKWDRKNTFEEDWRDAVEESFTALNVTGKDDTENFLGLELAGAHQQQSKEGGTVTLKSWRKPHHKETSEKEFITKVTDSFKEVVDNAKDLKPAYIRKTNIHGVRRRLNVLTADKHSGMDVRDALFGNRFTPEEFKRRVSEIVTQIDKLVQLYGKFEHISILDLGDPVDGYNGKTTRGHHPILPQWEGGNEAQFDVYVEAHIQLFDALATSGYANEISFLAACNDNHSSSFGYATNRAVEIYLNAKYPEISTKVAKEFIFHESWGDHRFIYTHGKDKEHMKYPMPALLNDKAEKLVNSYIAYNNLDKHIPHLRERQFIHLYKGDTHITAEQYGGRFRYKSVMSLAGSSDYIQLNYPSHTPQYKGFEWEIFEENNPGFIGGKHFYYDK